MRIHKGYCVVKKLFGIQRILNVKKKIYQLCFDNKIQELGRHNVKTVQLPDPNHCSSMHTKHTYVCFCMSFVF